MGTALTFHPAVPEDGPRILELLRQAAQWIQDAHGLDQWQHSLQDDFRERVEQWLKAGEFWTVRLNGKTVAVFRLLRNDPELWPEDRAEAFYVHTLTVDRRFKGQGLGERILQWVMDQAVREGKQFLRLDCMAGNPGLSDYYRQLGFTERGVRQHKEWEARLFEKRIETP